MFTGGAPRPAVDQIDSNGIPVAPLAIDSVPILLGLVDRVINLEGILRGERQALLRTGAALKVEVIDNEEATARIALLEAQAEPIVALGKRAVAEFAALDANQLAFLRRDFPALAGAIDGLANALAASTIF